MTAGDYFVQVAEFNERVDFGRRESPMTEELLDLTNVSAAFQ